MSHHLALVRVAVAAAARSSGGALTRAPAADTDFVTVPVNISPSSRCSRWPQALRSAGWRAFAKVCSQPQPCPRTDWLLKHEDQVFAFFQLERFESAQQLRLPPASAETILQVLERAGLLAH
jgi:hypothetical protein